MMSLRLRLVLIILCPLLMIAVLIGGWAVRDAQNRAAEQFDRSLLSAALAVSRDVAVSDGDAISPATNTLLRDTSGGAVFYHVFAPDGVFVTGYATPPVPPTREDRGEGVQTYFDSTYQGKPVRALRFVDAMQIDGLTGDFTISVWQDLRLRRAIVRDLSWRTFRVMASLVLALALLVWFGVRFGLRPLLELERAIGKRSSDDLTPIKRQVPVETQGVVERLNQLFSQVSSTLEAKDVFISNAAHQLRNPIAGVVAMSEAVQSARTFADMKERSGELASAARQTGDLANKLLALERAASSTEVSTYPTLNLTTLAADTVAAFEPRCIARDVSLTLQAPDKEIILKGDATMIGEALGNLIDNALIHAGPALSRIAVELGQEDTAAHITITDNGAGIPHHAIETVKERFVQADQSRGSGLGLAIAEAVAKHHDGALEIENLPDAFTVTVTLGTSMLTQPAAPSS